jgi:hypothetical protein
MKSPAQFPGVLTDEIITRSAPTKLISDSTRVETSKEVRGILCTYGISSWQSEPHQQHQNPAEQQYQTVKATLQHYSRPNRCSGLLLAPLLDVRMLRVEQCFLGSHPVYPSLPGLRHRQ